jgi:cytochrome P450
VREVLEAETPGISNANSLDPLVGFPRIIATPGAIPHFLRHLVPLPARATANLTDPELHKRVWDAMAGPTGYFTIAPDERSDRARTMRTHFHEEKPRFTTDGGVDLTGLSIAFAARLTGSAVGLPPKDWTKVATWSGAQSGLPGQWLRGRDLVDAVEALGQLFTVSAASIRTGHREQPTGFASRLAESGIPRRVAIAAMANSLAAGVHTIAGTIQQGVQRLLGDPERAWWSRLGDADGARTVAARVLQLDPGLVAWKRRSNRQVTLASGTVLNAGPLVALFAAANRDPHAFKDPFDLNSGGKLPLTFGFGKHVCPGKQLASLAVEVFLRELHDLAPRAQLQTSAISPAPRRPDLLFSGADVSIRENDRIGRQVRLA